MIERFLEAKQDMFAILRFRQIKFRAFGDDFFAECDEVLKHRLKRKRLRHAINERDDVVVKRFFELRVLVKIIQNRLRVGIILKLDDHANVFRRLITNVANAFDLFLMHEISHLLEEIGFIHAERDRGDDDLVIAPARMTDTRSGGLFPFHDLRLAAHHHAAAAGTIRMRDISLIKCDAAGGKIRTLHEAKQVFRRRFRIFDEVNARLTHFAQIVRRNVGCHADRDTERAIEKKIRNRRGHHRGLFLGVVVIRTELDRFFFDTGAEPSLLLFGQRIGLLVRINAQLSEDTGA